MPSRATLSPGRTWPRSMPSRGRERQCRSTGVPQEFDRREIERQVELEPLVEQPAVRPGRPDA